MSRHLKPEEIDNIGEKMDGAARKAAGKEFAAAVPFEPTPDGGPPQAHINLPHDTTARLRPKDDGFEHIDIDAKRAGQPMDMGKVTGKPVNDDGSVTTDVRDVPDTLKKLSELVIRADAAASYAPTPISSGGSRSSQTGWSGVSTRTTQTGWGEGTKR